MDETSDAGSEAGADDYNAAADKDGLLPHTTTISSNLHIVTHKVTFVFE